MLPQCERRSLRPQIRYDPGLPLRLLGEHGGRVQGVIREEQGTTVGEVITDFTMPNCITQWD